MLLLGPLAIVLCFALMRLQVEPFATFFYLLAWYGLIFTLDQLIKAREGLSLIARCGRGGFALLLCWSAVCWFFFELLNFRLENWYYIFVTDQPVLRLVGTFLAFATVFPGIFWIEHYLYLRGVGIGAHWRPLHFSNRGLYGLQFLGLLSLILPLVWPTYFFPLVWGALILLIAPINHRLGLNGFLHQLARGEYGQILRLLVAGLITGLCWEFFNFWARAKWIYTVPFFDELKLFEMPVAGFLGFPPFAVECAIVYRFLVWHRLAPPLGAFDQQRPSTRGFARPIVVILALLAALIVDYYMAQRTVSSVTPRIERMDGLDNETTKALKNREIRYLTQLEGLGSEHIWRELAEELGPNRYAELKRRTTLYLHQGIGIDYGNLLMRSGIGSLDQLAASSVDSVCAQLARTAPNAQKPSPAKIQVWIRRAQIDIVKRESIDTTPHKQLDGIP